MDDVLAMQIYPFQVVFWIAAFLGGLALVMTVSRIYGVISYLVNQRRKELGIRVALGAAAGDVVRMVVRQSARLAFLGVAVGVGLALSRASHRDGVRRGGAGGDGGGGRGRRRVWTR